MEKKISFTPSQSDAVNAPIGDILVSAAAGSGKTFVLTQRLLRLLCAENPLDITRMLIVTYTKAAASELKERISNAIRKELAEKPSNKNLRRQLDRVGRASISTIHSFCFNLIKENFSLLGLSSKMRVAEESEISVLKKQSMEEAIDLLYTKIDEPKFSSFIENFVSLRDTSLAEIFIKLYDKFMNYREGVEFVKNSAKSLRDATALDVTKTIYFKAINDSVENNLVSYKMDFEAILSEYEGEDDYIKYCERAFTYIIEFIDGWQEHKEQGHEALFAYINSYSAPGLGRMKKGEGEEFKELCKARKASFADFVKKLKSKYDVGNFKEESLALAELCDVLYHVLKVFSSEYEKEKKRLLILDFCDLERYTLRLLENSTIAEKIKEKYDCIYIDEYQDVNELQDGIFKAIASDNRFMVGDIKQSIYSFRGAEPSLFAGYRDSFSDYGDDAEGGKRIFLSDNFRSDKTVIDFVNMVFNGCFNFNSGRIKYMPEDALTHSKLGDEGDIKPELVYIEKTDENSEVDFVVSRVGELIKNGARPSEIAVIARKNKFLESVARAISSAGYDATYGAEDSIFDYPDVLWMICLLNCIDNPQRDIYLAGAAKSPIFGITLDELTVIRREYPELSLYGAVKEYSIHNDFEKGTVFISTLDAYRRYSESRSSDRIIKYIMMTTPIRAISINAGYDKSALTKFYDLAMRYEKGNFKGLHSFIKYVNNIISGAEEKSGEKVSGNSDGEAVNIMTIHKSKGLEFKYVILCDTARRIRPKDLENNIIYDKELGVASKIKGSDMLSKYDTYVRKAIASRIMENLLDEEMRNLYVALTRARMSLTVTCAAENIDKYRDDLWLTGAFPSRAIYQDSVSYMKWIAYSSRDRSLFTETVIYNPSSDVEDDVEPPVIESSENEKKAERVDHEVIISRLSYKYIYEQSVKIPTKISVSKLYPGILDEYEGEMLRSERAEFMEKPLFLGQSSKVTAADRGTATHLFMQFCDFERTLSEGIDSEIERLVRERYITGEAASIMYRDKLRVFFEGDLCKEICSAKKVIREKRFNASLEAAQFVEDENVKKELYGETVLVQGVIDCLIMREDGTYKLIDYKTDYVDASLGKEGESILRERYRTQLSYYKEAVEMITGGVVKELVIYSFSLGKQISI